jgi:hypothetical protein
MQRVCTVRENRRYVQNPPNPNASSTIRLYRGRKRRPPKQMFKIAHTICTSSQNPTLHDHALKSQLPKSSSMQEQAHKRIVKTFTRNTSLIIMIISSLHATTSSSRPGSDSCAHQALRGSPPWRDRSSPHRYHCRTHH